MSGTMPGPLWRPRQHIHQYLAGLGDKSTVLLVRKIFEIDGPFSFVFITAYERVVDTGTVYGRQGIRELRRANGLGVDNHGGISLQLTPEVARVVFVFGPEAKHDAVRVHRPARRGHGVHQPASRITQLPRPMRVVAPRLLKRALSRRFIVMTKLSAPHGRNLFGVGQERRDFPLLHRTVPLFVGGLISRAPFLCVWSSCVLSHVNSSRLYVDGEAFEFDSFRAVQCLARVFGVRILNKRVVGFTLVDDPWSFDHLPIRAEHVLQHAPSDALGQVSNEHSTTVSVCLIFKFMAPARVAVGAASVAPIAWIRRGPIL